MTVTVLVDGIVEKGIILDDEQLRPMALVLCDLGAHDLGMVGGASEKATRDYAEQYGANDGFCNTCRDLAGQILARFDVKERRQVDVHA